MTSPRTPRLIGFCGRAGSGKDAAASYLIQKHGFTKVAFADALRAAAAGITGWDVDAMQSPTFKATLDARFGFTPRQLLQLLGTEVGRAIDPDIWIKAWRIRAGFVLGPVLTPDVRFPNESAAIHAAGGKLVCIRRKSAEAVPVTHSSEASFLSLGHDMEIQNEGTLEHLWASVEDLLGGKP